MKKLIVLSIILIVVFSINVTAQSPQKVNYQAVVRDASGNAIVNKTISLRIGILQGSAFGTYIYVETHTPLTNQFGLVNLVIGDGTVSSGNLTEIDWSAGPYFLKVELDAAGGTSYSEMGTTQLLSVPYSLYSQNSEHSKTATTVETVDYGQLTSKPDLTAFQPVSGTITWDKVSDDDVTLTGDQNISGKKTFSRPVTVNNKLKATNENSADTTIIGINKDATGSAIAIIGITESNVGTAIKGVSPYTGVYGLSSSTDAAGSGVYGSSNSGSGSGVFGYNSKPDGKGVYGLSGATSGEGFGVYGRSSSPEGFGVYGANGYGGGIGVYGYSHNFAGSGCGIKGESKGLTGTGVYGIASSLTGRTFGIKGESLSSLGIAIYGIASHGTGNTVGIEGESVSTSGIGVYGNVTSATGTSVGVKGTSSSSSGTGVYGITTSTDGANCGVKGYTHSPSGGAGVLGVSMSETGTSYGVKGQSNSFTGYDFWAAGTGINYGAQSSSRWKSEIVPIADVLNKIKKLRGVYFTWDAEHGGNHDLGFIGEEVAKYFPEVVGKDPEAPGFVTGMDYSKMTPILLQAINEQQVIIETQNKQILDLLKRVEALETK